jgi:alkylated DNA repair dioxygenase AlkB
MVSAPEGFLYRSELLRTEEERMLLERLETIDFHEIRMHGVVAKRTARHFGFDYDYERRRLVQDAEPIPAWLGSALDAAATLADVKPEELVEALVQRYPPGAQIGWHRDASMFGTVVGISLLGPARLRLRRGVEGSRELFELELAPRSGYVLAREARTKWQHHILPAKELRYSITFRTLKHPERWTAGSH